jgi:hypothetical protein
MQGSVSIQPQGTDGWVAGAVNRPLTTADNIWADKDSRAELNVGTGVLRMNGETSLTLTNVSDSTVQLELHQGTLNLRVRRLYPGEIYEIDTPNMAFTVQKTGEYRFDVDSAADVSYVTVWKGEGDATGKGPATRVRAHERARFTGAYLAHDIDRAPGYDGFDDWCLVRDRRQDHALAAQYVAPGVIGYEDLDDYGSWRVLPTYGPVWVPAYVAPGWAPYHYGHWVWVSPWGWTWVDDAPWGFAPFHYGRWVYSGYWAWAPGPVYVRPVYAPALVAWFGGSNFSIGISFGGGYGWCPLGYGEPYIPWYRGSRNYFQRVNITNTHITNITYITNNYYGDHDRRREHPIEYRNLNAPGAVTAVSHRAIIDSLPVAKNAVPVSRKDAKDWGRNPVRDISLDPTRDSRLGLNADRPAVRPPDHVITRPVVAKVAPPMPRPGMQGPAAPVAKVERPLPARIADNQAPSDIPRPARAFPRPPQAGPSDSADVTARVPRPPAAANHDVLRGDPGIARQVPRPPEAGREADNRAPAPLPATRGGVSDPSGPARRTTLPAVREFPRPPIADNRTPGNDNSRMSRPEVNVDPGERQPTGNVPRPNGPVAAPRGVGPDEHVPRNPPASMSRPSSGYDRAPATPPSVSPGSPRGETSMPRSYGDSPRSGGGTPHVMQAPSAPHGAPPSASPHVNAAPAAPSGSHGAAGTDAPGRGRR